MNIFTPSEICAKLYGITTRQITDLAEKGIVKPAKDTPGQGSMRLYDKKNVRDILIALSLRGYVAGNALHNVLGEIKKTRKSIGEIEAISLKHADKKNAFYLSISFKDTDKESVIGMVNEKKSSTKQKQITPKSFSWIMVDIAAIDEFVAENF